MGSLISSISPYIKGIGQAATTVASVRAALPVRPKRAKSRKVPNEDELRNAARRTATEQRLRSGRASTLLSDDTERLGS